MEFIYTIPLFGMRFRSGLGKRIHLPQKVSKHLRHVWVLTSLGQGRFGKGAAFSRGLRFFKREFFIHMILNCIFLNRLAVSAITGLIDLVCFTKVQGDFVWKALRTAFTKCILDV